MSKFYTNVTKHKDLIKCRYVDANGHRGYDTVMFEPTFYVETGLASSHVGLFNEPLRDVIFQSMTHAKNAFEKHGHIYHGSDDFLAQYIQEQWPGDITFDPTKIVTANFDIEVDVSEGGFPDPEQALRPIDSITIKLSTENDYLVFTTKEYDPSKSELKDLAIRAGTYKDERALLLAFLNFWTHDYPDIVTGWFIRSFDIPYIVNRIRKVLGENYAKKLSPYGWVSKKEVAFKMGDMTTYDLSGIAVIDYKDAFQKFAYSYPRQESYSLNHIAYTVLGEKKLSYDEYGSLTTLGNENPQKYVDYNIKDVWLVEKLEEKLGLIGLIQTMAYKAGVNYSECFGTTRIWDSIIYRRLKSLGIQCPPKKDSSRAPYEGAYVKEPVPGMYEDVISYDFESLYPSTIVQWNMSPETILGHKSAYISTGTVPYSEASNGILFSHQKQGIIPQIIEEYKADRKKYKGEMLQAKQAYENTKLKEYDIAKTIANNQQMAVKILINALYGALANPYFRYYDVRIAEAITLTGQAVNNHAADTINQYLNTLCKTEKIDYVIAMDTDSVYINLGPFMKTIPDIPNVSKTDVIIKFCENYLEPEIETCLKDFYNQHNCFKPNLRMARDLIADRGIWTAKKRYLLSVLDAEGVRYETPQLKMTGIEAIKSSTPEVIRNWMKEIFPLVLKGDAKAVDDYITSRKKDYNALTLENIALPIGITDIGKFRKVRNQFVSGTPMHVRAALVYNEAIAAANLTEKYKTIGDGDKIKYLHLRVPNPVRENVIGFLDVFPRELNLDDYVDRSTMFEKSFLKPLDSILAAAGMSVEDSVSLEGFFT